MDPDGMNIGFAVRGLYRRDGNSIEWKRDERKVAEDLAFLR